MGLAGLAGPEGLYSNMEEQQGHSRHSLAVSMVENHPGGEELSVVLKSELLLGIKVPTLTIIFVSKVVSMVI